MIQLVALDADDTLWHNEPLYRGTERQSRLLTKYEAPGVIEERLYETAAQPDSATA
jgi:putative hydrolase of the HAD superfamily